VDRSYAAHEDVATLDDWLYSKSPNIQFHIRPGVQLLKTWDLADAEAQDRRGEFTVEVRHAIDQVLSALGEAKIAELQPQTASRKSSTPPKKQIAKSMKLENVAATKPACPICHMVHAGECL
jgi:hypothetical protein